MSGFKLEAVVMDRDGVLNKYVRGDYIRTPDELHLLPGAAEAIKLLNDANLPVIVVSNQQGVGKRIMTEDALDQVDGELRFQLKAQADAHITRTIYCVHLAEDHCECRKPAPGMILQAADEYSFDLNNCVMIGDSLTDIESGNNAAVAKTVLLMSGVSEMVEYSALQPVSRPTYIARDLYAAVTRLLEDFGA
jgi:D-glycero-D-manno-heptose 1,7-bisphosphate phosphatase